MEKNLNDGTSYRQSDKPILCANGCGFFGTAATMNLCSKCYRDRRLKEEQAASIAKSMMTSSSARVTSPLVVVVDEVKKAVEVTMEPVEEEQAASVGTSVMTSSSARVTSAPVVEKAVEVTTEPSEKELVKVKSRCGICNKKVGVMGFRCRCGNTFCGSHRYPEEHMCEFDFKSVGRDAIKKANPVVKADKIQRF